MKILYILDYFSPSKGGVERVFENIIKFFSKKHKIIILTSKFDKNLPYLEKHNNITIYRVGKNRLWFTLYGSILGLKLAKNVDLIHSSSYNGAYICKFISIFYRKPIILTSHEIIGKNWKKIKGSFKKRFFEKLENIIYNNNFFYVFVSHHVKNVALSKYKIKDFCVIYNGVDIPSKNSSISKEKLGFQKNDIIGVFAGRPGYLKGLDFLLKLYPKIKQINPNFKLLLLLLEKNNKKKLSKTNKYLTKDIKILYEIDHKKVYDYLNIADIGIVPSRSEGFGLTALEFSLLKKACLFSFVGAIPEINFGDCHFFKPDNETEFLKKINEIFIGKKNNYSYNKLLTIEKMNKNYNKLYEKIIKLGFTNTFSL